MATKKEREEKKDYARILFMQGDSQKVIAEKTGISAQTITKCCLLYTSDAADD